MYIQSMTIDTKSKQIYSQFVTELALRATFSSHLTVYASLKFGYSEKATKYEKIFHLEFDVTEYCQILSGRFFQILWPS